METLLYAWVKIARKHISCDGGFRPPSQGQTLATGASLYAEKPVHTKNKFKVHVKKNSSQWNQILLKKS